MKFFLLSALVILAASCSNRSKQAVYDMLHEKERQDCLRQGKSDCPHTENYEQYKKQREEIIN